MPWPIADQALVQELLGIVQQATRYHQLKKGVNEATKNVNPSVSERIVMAGDISPLAITKLVRHLLCEEKNVPDVWVLRKTALGQACRPIIGAGIGSSDKLPVIWLLRLSGSRAKVERLDI
ncbi:RNA binding protein snu13 [Talaromyces marneffei ATCC 18224]